MANAEIYEMDLNDRNTFTNDVDFQRYTLLNRRLQEALEQIQVLHAELMRKEGECNAT